MMLVKIMGFGSNWWARVGPDPDDHYRYTKHAAYFNSAGVRCGNKVRRHWIVPGLVRFNGVGGFDPRFPLRAIGETFECPALSVAYGGNRLTFLRKAQRAVPPDYYLVVISNDSCGAFRFDDPAWKSGSVLPIAVSQLRDKQEAILLMKPFDSIRSSLGTWQFKTATNVPHGASLELLEDAVLN